jgi:PTS system nitrogen regulatory IIA component
MEEDILTIEEVAKYLRVSERTVYDWAQKGEIPAGKIGTVWRFRKSEIERWVSERLSGNKSQSTLQILSMKNIVTQDRIVFLNYPRKRDALIALAENLATAPQVKNKGELVTEILRREELMSTAIGRGVAIPHVRLTSITDLVVSVGISTCEIADFTAFDDTTVRLLFMIGSAYNQHAYYLQTLSFFSSQLKSDSLRTSLINAKTPEEAYTLLTQSDYPR